MFRFNNVCNTGLYLALVAGLRKLNKIGARINVYKVQKQYTRTS